MRAAAPHDGRIGCSATCVLSQAAPGTWLRHVRTKCSHLGKWLKGGHVRVCTLCAHAAVPLERCVATLCSSHAMISRCRRRSTLSRMLRSLRQRSNTRAEFGPSSYNPVARAAIANCCVRAASPAAPLLLACPCAARTSVVARMLQSRRPLSCYMHLALAPFGRVGGAPRLGKSNGLAASFW
jgi:hypothetical protein